MNRPGVHGVASPRNRAILSLVGRSFFPLFALLAIAGTMVWGPVVSLVLVFALWHLVARFA